MGRVTGVCLAEFRIAGLGVNDDAIILLHDSVGKPEGVMDEISLPIVVERGVGEDMVLKVGGR